MLLCIPVSQNTDTVSPLGNKHAHIDRQTHVQYVGDASSILVCREKSRPLLLGSVFSHGGRGSGGRGAVDR